MNKEILKDIIHTPISGEWGDEGNRINVLRTTNFNNDGTLNLESVVKRDIAEKRIEQKLLRQGDIIIEKSGGSPNQPVGRVVFFDQVGEYLCNNFTSILRPKNGSVIPKYLHYLLFANHRYGIVNAFQNKTTGIINLKLQRYIEKTQFPLPSLQTQKKIAHILDQADALKKRTEQIIDCYDQLAQSIFLDMFGDPVTNPMGWQKSIIENLVVNKKYAIKRGPFGGALKKEIFVDDGYLVYEQYHALNNDFGFGRYYIDEFKYNELESFAVKPGDIIISCSGVYLGKLAVIPPRAKEGIINQALLKITLDQKRMRNDFFQFHFTHRNFRNKFFGANRGAGIPNFPPMSDFKKFPFIVPPISLQNQFSDLIKEIKQQKDIAKQSFKESEDLFNTLLQKAFKGELVNSE